MKIICVGRNYVDHAKELKNEVPTEPVIFLKPETAILPKRNPFFIPDFTNEVHYEAELVIRINKIGKNIQEKFAYKYYDEVTVGLDFTARDLQQKLKEKGLPWEKAKAFDGSAAVGKFISLDKIQDFENLEFTLHKNGELAQKGSPQQMIFSIHKLIAYVSQYFTLKIGDLIYTGTPAGVGKVENDDQLELKLNEQTVLKLNVK